MIALTALLAYLLGSVPFGIVWCRVFGLGDPRAIGSGSIGATNVLRTGSRAAAALTLVCDAGKGAAAAALAGLLPAGELAAQVAGMAAFLGHAYPVFLGLRGGKAVATGAGVVLVLAWPVGLALVATWGVAAAATRISSAGALAAAASAPLWAWLLGREDLIVFTALLGLAIAWFHRANIARLRAGTEPRIGGR